MTSSNGNICRVTGHLWGNSPVPGEFPAQRPVTRSFDVSLICVWINGWVNNREAGDLRRYRAHCDVTVMGLTRSSEDGRDLWILQVSPEKNKPSSFFSGRFLKPCRAGFILRNKNMFTISTNCQRRGGTGGWSLSAWKRQGPSYPVWCSPFMPLLIVNSLAPGNF